MPLFKSLPAALALLSAVVVSTGILHAQDPLERRSISELEEKRDRIQEELEQLSVFTLRTGALGTSGYRSFPQDAAETEDEWIQIDLQKEADIDEIALVPTLWRHDDEEGYRSDGFPKAFRILAGSDADPTGSVVAEFDASDDLLPRVAPIVVPLSGIRASWIRIQPTLLSKRERDWKYIFQLSEVLVFSGEKNVALHQEVTCATSVPLFSGIWKPDLIVDGGMPYFMDSSQGSERSAHSQYLRNNPSLTLDLEATHPISSIHLHAAYQSKSAPPEFNVNWGIPKLLTIEGANQPDFSDSTTLLKHQFKDIGKFAPILVWNIPETNCRYLKITGALSDPEGANPSGYKGSDRIGFAEIEFLADGHNVALGKGPINLTGKENPGWAKLTDGHNFYGHILPIRTWMNQLARRHDLEAELTLLSAHLETRYEKQQSTLLLLKRLTIGLLLLVAATFLIGRHLRRREAARIRNRFTADLHDHVGASLHALGILSSHTKDLVDSPEKLSKALDEIEVMTGRAGEATRDFYNQQMAEEAHENLLGDLRRTAGRMIANLHHDFTVEGEEFLQQLNSRLRSDFFLFFKESLININRHADATEVKIDIQADPREVHLSISDNGCGIPEGEQGTIPPSLARRARFLGSKVVIETPEDGGTRISIKLKTRRAIFTNPFRLEK